MVWLLDEEEGGIEDRGGTRCRKVKLEEVMILFDDANCLTGLQAKRWLVFNQMDVITDRKLVMLCGLIFPCSPFPQPSTFLFTTLAYT